ncbi:MAG: SDR family NAD(P)-dependent oxidoreductase, partial [Giesbergeria sp.]
SILFGRRLLDGALQAVIGLRASAAEDGGQAPLPFALQTLEVYGECSAQMWVVARRGETGDRLQTFDLDVCCSAGQVRVRMRGFVARTPDAAPFAGAMAAAPAQTLLLQPHWRTAAVPTGTAPTGTERLVLLCAGTVDPAALSAHLDCRCERLDGDCAAQAEALRSRVQALLQAGSAAPALVQVVVADSGPQQVSAGLGGLLRSARREQPLLCGQVIALDGPHDVARLACQLEDNSRSPLDMQIRYVQGERQVLDWHELPAVPAAVPWRDAGVYLVTGGLGGLGRIVALEIARQARGVTLVLVGRRGLDALRDGPQQLRALQALGATVQYHALDIADGQAVHSLVQAVCQAHGGLHGIVHAAGVLSDGLLVHKTSAELAGVLAPKWAGMAHLDEASRDLPLDFFLCFSSIAAAYGNAGQADYAAANALVDAYAAHRNSLLASGQRHGRTLSVNWPLWQGGGMRPGAAAEQALAEATGMVPMSSASGIAALYQAWGSGLGQVMVLAGDALRLRRTLAPVTMAPTLAATAPGHGSLTGVLAQQAGQYLRTLFADTLHLPPASVEIDLPLERYGIDSILAMKLTTALEAVFGSLSKTLFFEYQTLQALAEHFVAHHAATLA